LYKAGIARLFRESSALVRRALGVAPCTAMARARGALARELPSRARHSPQPTSRSARIMNSQRILGALLLAGGIALLFLGLHATDSVAESVKEGVTGRYTDKTTLYIVGGAALTVVGAALAFFGIGRSSHV
jgi:hypothetical protein